MSQLRHRGKSLKASTGGEDSDSDIGSGTATPVPVAKGASGWGVRTKWTLILLGTFCVLIAFGHPTLTVLVMVCQIFMYKEIVAIGFKWNKEKEIPLFRTLNWYFYFSATFLVYFRALGPMMLDTPFLYRIVYFPVHYHTFIFYSLFCIGIVMFVLTLKKNYYKYQFQQLAWTVMSLILVVFPTTFIISNMYQGIIWFILPALLVVANDIFAFIFGKLFGRTPLISLSPKKTWEGFIGATLTTFVFGFFVFNYLLFLLSKYFF